MQQKFIGIQLKCNNFKYSFLRIIYTAEDVEKDSSG